MPLEICPSANVAIPLASVAYHFGHGGIHRHSQYSKFWTRFQQMLQAGNVYPPPIKTKVFESRSIGGNGSQQRLWDGLLLVSSLNFRHIHRFGRVRQCCYGMYESLYAQTFELSDWEMMN